MGLPIDERNSARKAASTQFVGRAYSGDRSADDQYAIDHALPSFDFCLWMAPSQSASIRNELATFRLNAYAATTGLKYSLTWLIRSSRIENLNTYLLRYGRPS